MTERYMVRAGIGENMEFNGDGLWKDHAAINILKFKKWIDDTVAEIPEEVRDQSVIVLGEFRDWDDEYHHWLEIEYPRPETDREVESRLMEEARLDALRAIEKAKRDAYQVELDMKQKEKDRQDYERLKAIFERK